MDGKLAVAVGALVAAWAAASMCWRGGPVVCGCEPCGRNGAACGHRMGETVGEIMKLMAQSWWGNDTDCGEEQGMVDLPLAMCGDENLASRDVWLRYVSQWWR